MSSDSSSSSSESEPSFATVLARLLSDRNLRVAFIQDRRRVYERLSLSATLRRQLDSLDSEQLEQQAAGLIRKRLHAVRLLLPATFERNAESVQEVFWGWADGFWPAGYRRHEIDAIEFGRVLLHADSQLLDRSEWNRLRFQLSHAWFRAYLIRQTKTPPKLSLQVLVRIDGQPRQISWTIF